MTKTFQAYPRMLYRANETAVVADEHQETEHIKAGWSRDPRPADGRPSPPIVPQAPQPPGGASPQSSGAPTALPQVVEGLDKLYGMYKALNDELAVIQKQIADVSSDVTRAIAILEADEPKSASKPAAKPSSK